jgi:hypothetical protein
LEGNKTIILYKKGTAGKKILSQVILGAKKTFSTGYLD